MKYIIANKSNTSFYKGWSNIGPMFTDKEEEALDAETKMDFVGVIGHFAFVGYDIKERG